MDRKHLVNTYLVTHILNQYQFLPEQIKLEKILSENPEFRRAKLTSIDSKSERFDIYSCHLGSESPYAPVLIFTGGVHGLERIGCQVILAFMQTLLERLKWDDTLNEDLKKIRILFVPLVNPVGISQGTRSNGNGVDLMRNSPIDASDRTAFLVGGHRISAMLPWYRGKKDTTMETEAKVLCRAIKQELTHSPFTLALDIHSGFGFKDRLWFPPACSREPPKNLVEYYEIYQLLNRTYPNLDYVFEPQSQQYITHGDLWDYLYFDHINQARSGLFLPLTLEMGSWNWIKKNPIQLLSFPGLFNPIKPHRTQRVLRRHTVLLECLIRMTRSFNHWLPLLKDQAHIHDQAFQLWYRHS